jgi:hypothetical protein
VLTPETLDHLEAQASMRVGLEISTPVAINPGDLRELIACYRNQGLTTAEYGLGVTASQAD